MFSKLVGRRDCYCFVFLPVLGLFWETDWLFQQDVQAWISLCALFLFFFYFWPWKLVALNVTGLCHHRQLPRPMRAKPHLPDARFLPICTASICVYACVYIDIYIKREKYLWIYFFPILWREILIRNKQKKRVFFWWNTAMLFWREVFIFLEVDYEYW